MTNVLLIIIAVLLLARMVLQVWQGNETLNRVYATASEVEHNFRHVPCDTVAIRTALADMADKKWEFIGVCGGEDDTLILFFTRKKIKSYMM